MRLCLFDFVLILAAVAAFAVVMPDAHAHHNANLFVSAEDPRFQHHIAGPQVIEVAISDPINHDTDRARGEPDVTINGNTLRMVQGIDGNWYGYFADSNMAKAADGTGINFGAIDSSSDEFDELFSDTEGVAYSGRNPGYQMNIVREAKAYNTINNPLLDTWDYNDNSDPIWPFVQLYDLSKTVTVQYNKVGDIQTVMLVFDEADDLAGLYLDRDLYPQRAQIQATIVDTWLNIDPTDQDSWTFDSLNGIIYYQVFDKDGNAAGSYDESIVDSPEKMMCNDSCILYMDTDVQNTGTSIIGLQRNMNSHDESVPFDASDYITVLEQSANIGVFGTYDELGISEIYIDDDAQRGTSAALEYNNAEMIILVGNSSATIDMTLEYDTIWRSGDEILIILEDDDSNTNNKAREVLTVHDSDTLLIPALKTGNPFTLGSAGTEHDTSASAVLAYFGFAADDNIEITNPVQTSMTIDMFSDRAVIFPDVSSSTVNSIILDLDTDISELRETLFDPTDSEFKGFNFYSHDVQSLDSESTYDVYLLYSDGPIIESSGDVNDDLTAVQIADNVYARSGLVHVDDTTASNLADPGIASQNLGIAIVSSNEYMSYNIGVMPIVADFFSYGFINDGILDRDRIANQIIRIEAEESGDDTGIFEGELKYIMLNQLNILDKSTYEDLSVIDNDPTFVAINRYVDQDSVSVNYFDLGADGVHVPISSQQEIPTHSAVVSLDADSYRVAQTVNVTLEDADLNTYSNFIDIYTISDLPDTVGTDVTFDGNSVELNSGNLGRILDVTFDDSLWTRGGCSDDSIGLAETGFTLVETNIRSGIFTGSFLVPQVFCFDDTLIGSSVGTDLEVHYVDFRDASGETVETSASAHITASAGLVSFDRTVYPVPFAGGVFETNDEPLPQGDLSVHIRVNDPDYDISGSGEDVIDESGTIGPIKVSVSREGESIVLGYAGGDVNYDTIMNAIQKTINDKSNKNYDGDLQVQIYKGAGISDNRLSTDYSELTPDEMSAVQREITEIVTIDDKSLDFDSIEEIAPDTGIFEIDIDVAWNDGPQSNQCPDDGNCILQGDIITVEYTDPTDASGEPSSVTDHATFDLRSGQLQSDKAAYMIGSDIILTLIEPDFDLDANRAETYPLHLIEWDSDAYIGTIGGVSAFDPDPPYLKETDDSTGIFQTVLEVPSEINGYRLEQGEEIVFEYVDYGPTNSDYVGDETKDVNLTVFTSDLGVTLEISAYHDANSNGEKEIGEGPFHGLSVLTYTPSSEDAHILITRADGTSSAILAPVAFYAIALPDVGYEITTNPFQLGSTTYNGVLNIQSPDAGSTHKMEIGVATIP